MTLEQIKNITPEKILNKCLATFGYQLTATHLSYFDAKKVVAAAKAKELPLCDYLELYNVGGVGKRRDVVIDALLPNLPLTCDAFLEIGAGTGMYLEKLIEHYHPATTEIYEVNKGWVKYLLETYGATNNIVCHPTNGYSLGHTISNSIDIVVSHGVFVYLPIMDTYSYLEEMARVCKQGGYIVFDCFTATNFGATVIKHWLRSPHRFPVVVSDLLIEEYAIISNLTLKANFNIPYHESSSTYFIFQKN